MMLALSLKGEIYSFSPRRTLAHMRTVTSAFQARNLASRTVRRSRRSAYPLFDILDESFIAPDSLIREFIGGGIYDD
mgnify:CR=1 FL=1